MKEVKEKKERAMTAEIIIIGGGASGLMAAIAAGTIFSDTDSTPGGQSLRPAAGGSAPGAYMPVLLFERMDKTGRKILATGNGRCNFSNTYMDQSCWALWSKIGTAICIPYPDRHLLY